MMWGTTSPSAKLTGDSGSAFEALLIDDCRLFRSLAEKLAAAPFGTFATISANNGRRLKAVPPVLIEKVNAK
jgi:hypothetical protein